MIPPEVTINLASEHPVFTSPSTNPTLSVSQLGTWNSCRMKWFFHYNGIYPVRRESHALALGTAVHELLDLFLSGKPTDPRLNEMALEAPDIAGEAERLLDEVRKGPQRKIVTTELQLSSSRETLSGRVYAIRGILDAVVLYDDESLWRMEHKTTSRMNSLYLQGLSSGLQTGVYHWLAESVYKPLKGTIYNILINTKTPQYTSAAIPVNKNLVIRSIAQCDVMADEIMDGLIYRNLLSCASFNQQCQYRSLCNRPDPCSSKRRRLRN